MSFRQTFFGFNGRLARLPYLGCSILPCLGGIVVALGVAILSSFESKLPGVAVILGIAVILGGVIAATWSSLALTIKRLHDMGRPGVHLIWIWLLGPAVGTIAGLLHAPAPLTFLVSFGLGCWLLFSRGDDGPNRYGPPPGMPPGVQQPPALSQG